MALLIFMFACLFTFAIAFEQFRDRLDSRMVTALSQPFLACSNCLSTYFGKSKLLLGHCVFLAGANKDDMWQMSPEFPVSFSFLF